jgi:HAD superfamily hydrolase (TIGR01509 family)
VRHSGAVTELHAATTRSRPDVLSAVFFDMDGLLVDTEPLWTLAEEELARRLGGTFPDGLKAAIVGTRLDVAVPTLLRWYGVDPTPMAVARTASELLGRMVALFAEPVVFLPGALALARALRAQGVPLALVSSSYRVLVDAALAHAPGLFDVTVAGDEVARGKPDPEPYLTAAGMLGVPAPACVVLEDSPAGVASGEAAACAVVAVPAVAGVVMAPAPRRLVVRSLVDVTVDDLRALVAVGRTGR